MYVHLQLSFLANTLKHMWCFSVFAIILQEVHFKIHLQKGPQLYYECNKITFYGHYFIWTNHIQIALGIFYLYRLN